jgi:hypothetical protein
LSHLPLSFSALSHGPSFHRRSLRPHTTTPTFISVALIVSLARFLTADSPSGRAPPHPRHWYFSLSLSLSLHLSLINPISHFFVTLPEIEIGFWLHFSLHACFEFLDLGFLMNLSLLRVNFWVLLTLFCD